MRQFLPIAYNSLNKSEHFLSGLSAADTRPRSFKQTAAKVTLQFGQLTGQLWLPHTKAFGCGTDAARLGCNRKASESGERNGCATIGDAAD
ncbi:hypothetical protein D3C80_1023510 [compost metagenome]